MEASQIKPRHVRQYKALRDSVSDIGVLQQNLKRILSAPDRFGWDRQLEHGRLDVRHLRRAYRGAKNVHKMPLDYEAENTAVMIVGDGSGSMRGHEADAQTAMAIHIAETVEKANCECILSVFQSRSLRIVKRANEKMRDPATKWKVQKMRNIASGGTPLSAAIVKAIGPLVQLEATRRIMIVLTDGGDSKPARMPVAIQMAQNQGIEIVGIGIGYDCPRIFEKADAYAYAKVHNLSGGVFKAMIDEMQKGKRK